ncbi:MAG: DUF1345 domain-containing protein [Candidatus Saccharimonadales bacterium]
MKRSKRVRFLTAILFGIVVGYVTLIMQPWIIALLAGWDAAAIALLVLLWLDFHGRTAAETARVAKSDDMGKTWLDSVVVLASVVSIAAVAVLLTSQKELWHVGLGLASIVVSWAIVHAIYTLRYAALYYREPEGGVNFNDQAKPRFIDFAYLAYTLGMTYQVSDTTFTHSRFRSVALRHALLSFMFGTAIIATTINFIASLSQ